MTPFLGKCLPGLAVVAWVAACGTSDPGTSPASASDAGADSAPVSCADGDPLLPSGACGTGSTCQPRLSQPCDGGGAVHREHSCACEGGAWSCEPVPGLGGICPSPG
ncbi:MAG: hypothetical protein IT376_23125 [Polyangiaceae bacterium]|nr:hypothetical protein [Polyangiaceae bacterium]